MRTEKKPVIEALLFVAGTPLSLKELQKLTGLPKGEIQTLISELQAEYTRRGSGIRIVEVAEGYQMVTAPEVAEWIKPLKGGQAGAKLSRAALETLAIVAYRQPITKAEIEELRGVNSDAVIKSLLEKRLIRVVGKKEVPGRPLLYGTTKEFLLYFGLKDLSELPEIEELAPGEL